MIYNNPETNCGHLTPDTCIQLTDKLPICLMKGVSVYADLRQSDFNEIVADKVCCFESDINCLLKSIGKGVTPQDKGCLIEGLTYCSTVIPDRNIKDNFQSILDRICSITVDLNLPITGLNIPECIQNPCSPQVPTLGTLLQGLLDHVCCDGCGASGSTVCCYEELTYAQLSSLIALSSVIPNRLYKIIDRGDRGIFVTGISETEVSQRGIRKMLCPAHYEQAIFSGKTWIGVWNPTKTVSVNNLTIWGGLVWKNLTGNIGSNIDDITLSSDWQLVPKTSFTDEYSELQFNIIYDFANDWINMQSDNKGNIIGGAKVLVSSLLALSFNPVDLTDWNCNTSNYYFFNNVCLGVFNNSNGNGVYNNHIDFFIKNNYNTLEIQGNANKGHIANNSNNGNISTNNNIGEITENSCIGDSAHIYENSNLSHITLNSNRGAIYYNSNNGVIALNRNNGYIAFNSNNGGVLGNSNKSGYSSGASIYANSNGGDIGNNQLSGNIRNNKNGGDIIDNIVVGSIYGNFNTSSINDNINTGDITFNSNAGVISFNEASVLTIKFNNNLGDITNNKNSGRIENNSNNGVISVSSGVNTTTNIIYNVNNGYIINNVVGAISDTIVNK